MPLGKVGEFDSCAVRRESANYPLAVDADERVRYTNGVVDDVLIVDLGFLRLSERHAAGGWSQCLRFASNLPTPPVGQGDESLTPKASQTGNAVDNSAFQARLGQKVLKTN